MATIVAAAGGGNWQTNATWTGNVKPTAADDVQLTSTSGNVTIDSGAVCRSLDCTGYTGTLTHNAIVLNIGDATAGAGSKALTFVSGMTYTLINTTTSAISFISTSATQQTVTWASKIPGNVTFNGAAASWIYGDAPGTSVGTLSLLKGTLNLNGKTFTIASFNTNFNNTRTLTLGAANITVTTSSPPACNLSSSGTLTMTANTAIITLTGADAVCNMDGFNYNGLSLVFSGSGAKKLSWVGGNFAIICANVTCTGTASKLDTFILDNGDLTCTGTFTCNGNSTTNRIFMLTNAVGTRLTITAATVSCSNIDVMDIAGAGAGSWNLAAIAGNSGDCLGNSGITFTTPATQTHTSTAGGNWSDSTKWTSRVPLPQDNVVVNSNTTGTLTGDMPRLGANINFTGFIGTWADSLAQTIYGSLTLDSGQTITGTNTLTLAGRSSKTITSSSNTLATFSIVIFNGSYTIQDTFIAAVVRVNINGTLACGSQTLTISNMTVNSGGTLTGSGTINLTQIGPGNIWSINSGTMNYTGSIIITNADNNNRTFAGGGKTYNTLTYTAGTVLLGSLSITGANTFTTLNIGANRILSLPSSTTTTCTTFNVNGTANNVTTLNSSASGTAATLSVASGSVHCNYLSIKDSTVTGGAFFTAANSTNVSGNTGWNFLTADSNNLLNPTLDVSDGTWTDQAAGTDLRAAIDEDVASDTDYIQSAAGPNTDISEVFLETAADPNSSTGHIVHYRYQKNVSGGAVDLIVSLRQGASTEIASWTHTEITNSWTTANQTLTSGQADSITDYTDLRLRFSANMTTSDMAITKVADRGSTNSNSTISTITYNSITGTVGNYLIIRTAADNSGGGGAARSLTITGTLLDLTTLQQFQQNNDPGAASDGTTCNLAIVKISSTTGTVVLSYSGSVVQADVIEEWSGIVATTPVVGTPVGATATASNNLASCTDSSVASGNLAYGVGAIEGPSSDTYTEDTDTTNGSWTSLTKLGTSNATADTNQTVVGAYKIVTAAGAQTWNPTGNNTRDSAGIIAEFTKASPTIRAEVSWAQLEIPSAGGAVIVRRIGKLLYPL